MRTPAFVTIIFFIFLAVSSYLINTPYAQLIKEKEAFVKKNSASIPDKLKGFVQDQIVEYTLEREIKKAIHHGKPTLASGLRGVNGIYAIQSSLGKLYYLGDLLYKNASAWRSKSSIRLDSSGSHSHPQAQYHGSGGNDECYTTGNLPDRINSPIGLLTGYRTRNAKKDSINAALYQLMYCGPAQLPVVK